MKKILLIILLWTSLNVVAQDSSKVKADTTYAVILSKLELQWLIGVIKNQDEKPSVIKAQIEAISQKIQMIPNKEKPKK